MPVLVTFGFINLGIEPVDLLLRFLRDEVEVRALSYERLLDRINGKRLRGEYESTLGREVIGDCCKA